MYSIKCLLDHPATLSDSTTGEEAICKVPVSTHPAQMAARVSLRMTFCLTSELHAPSGASSVAFAFRRPAGKDSPADAARCGRGAITRAGDERTQLSNRGQARSLIFQPRQVNRYEKRQTAEKWHCLKKALGRLMQL